MSDSLRTTVTKDKDTEKTNGRSRERTQQLAPESFEAEMLGLHSAIGNQAVGQLFETGNARSSVDGARIQRKCDCGGTCADCQKGQERLQRKTIDGSAQAYNGNGIPPAVRSVVENGGGTPLDSGTRSLMESRFNQNFGNVRVHASEAAARAARTINAQAFTLGNSIWFGRGRFQPKTAQGQLLLAHELAHTVQQRGRPVSVQRSLQIGDTNDSAETAADMAAAAVLANRAVPSLRPAAPMLRRRPDQSPFDPRDIERAIEQTIPQVSETDNPNVVNVRHENNTYRVHRRITGWREECETVEANEPARLSADFDRSNAWIQVEWCRAGGRSTRGRVRFGADIPDALLQSARNIIFGGQNPRETLRNLDITPFVEVDIARSEQFRIRARGETTVRPGVGEVRRGRGSIGLEVPGGQLEIFGEVAPGQGPRGETGLTGGVQFSVPLESAPEQVECRHKEICRYVPEYTLECIRQIPEQHSSATQARFLYFEYASNIIATPNSSTGRQRRAENNIAAALNDGEIPQIRQLIDSGWQVSEIHGFTSPEGPRQQQSEGRFIGNQALSQNRATAAQNYIEGLCNPGGALSMRRRTCIVPNAPIQGEGELLTADDPRTGRELEGSPLASQAGSRFLQSGEEAARRTTQVEQQIATATPQQQGSLVYPRLRRAAITFTKVETTPAREQRLAQCPAEVGQAARTYFDNRQRSRASRRR